MVKQTNKTEEELIVKQHKFFMIVSNLEFMKFHNHTKYPLFYGFSI